VILLKGCCEWDTVLTPPFLAPAKFLKLLTVAVKFLKYLALNFPMMAFVQHIDTRPHWRKAPPAGEYSQAGNPPLAPGRHL
jgi:hypothetical protein